VFIEDAPVIPSQLFEEVIKCHKLYDPEEELAYAASLEVIEPEADAPKTEKDKEKKIQS